jgi:hypothetical protein
MASEPLGIDLRVTTDLDPTFRLCRGQENLNCALLRRLNTEAGALAEIGGNPDYGYDVGGELDNEQTGQASLARVHARVTAELMKDPRVQAVDARVVSTLGGGGDATLTIPITGESATGPFAFVAGVSDMSVDFLKQGTPQGVPATQGQIVGQTIQVISLVGGGSTIINNFGGGTGGATSVEPNLDGLFATDSGNEDLLKQGVVSFSALSGATVALEFVALVRALDGASGTFRVRLGGTDGVVDGTVVATISTSSGTYTRVSASVVIARPSGVYTVKLTGQSNTAWRDAMVKSAEAVFSNNS